MNTKNTTHHASKEMPYILRIAEVEKRTGYKMAIGQQENLLKAKHQQVNDKH